MDETRPYPGVARMLDGAARRRLPMGVVSNKPQRFTEACVEKLLGRWRFAVVRGARPQVPLKPDPAGPLAAARAMKVAAREVLYLGDTSVDMKAARAAGMFAVGALWGFRDAEELRASGRVAHVSETSGDAEARLRAAGIERRVVLENLARAAGVEDAHRGLMNSPGHRANVLAREVNGSVDTVLDTRGAAVAGIAAALGIGLMLIIAGLLGRRRKL